MNDAFDIATHAFHLFAHGWATGDFQPYIDMLADDVEFSFPEGEQGGHFTGKEGRLKMIAKCKAHADSGERLTLHPPHHITSNGTTTVFEFVAEGMLVSGFYRGEIAIALEVKEGKVCGFREYYGFAG